VRLLRRGVRPADVTEQSRWSGALWAVRRDWPTGDHEFVDLCDGPTAAGRALESDRAFWRWGPMRPALSVVRISAHDFALHGRARRGCRAPDCPCD
jgi:hypothetical protein